jgi:predicted RNA-binding protein YlqC (UPF0109 family)
MNATSTDPREFLEFMVSSLVDNPDDIEIAEIDKDKGTIYELGVHADDLSGLIGRRGKVAAALRTVLDACAYKHDRRARLVILDEPSEDALEDGEEEATN